jgi:hypothetical protein
MYAEGVLRGRQQFLMMKALVRNSALTMKCTQAGCAGSLENQFSDEVRREESVYLHHSIPKALIHETDKYPRCKVPETWQVRYSTTIVIHSKLS